MAQKFWRIRFKFFQCILNCNFVKFFIYLPLKSVWPFIWTLTPFAKGCIVQLEIFKHHYNFAISQLSPLGKGCGHSFEQSWILFTQRCFEPSLVETSPVILEIWTCEKFTDRQTETDGRRKSGDQWFGIIYSVQFSIFQLQDYV